MEGATVQCPKCQFDNREGAKFCKRCGIKLEYTCPQCSASLTPDSLFCDECGYDLKSSKETLAEFSEPEWPTHCLKKKETANRVTPIEGERKIIHERIVLVMEQLFKERLPEFYETLAFHFSQATSLHKAVDYLIKSGEKSLKRYAVEESHQYYQQAYNLLVENESNSKENLELLFDLLNKWSLVYYYRGDYKAQTQLLKRHESEAALLEDKEKQGMFYGWLGFILQFRWELEDSVRYLQKAIELGEASNAKRIIGYAYTWLIYAYAPLTKYEEGYLCWEKAVSISKSIETDAYLYFKSMAGISHLEFFIGENKHSYEIGNQLLEYGKMNFNIRCQVAGHICLGHSYFSEGNQDI
jgi:tetratricopeptide (TPR) repeat protein